MEKRISQLELGQPMEQTKASFACATQVWLAVNHTPVSLLANESDGRSVFHRK